MARELIQLGTSPTGSDGDTARAAFTKVNAMTGELYAASDLAAAKLATIAEGATANATDAQLRDRATHTGTQAISTVSGLQVALDGKQPSNANLTAFSGLTGAADRLPYFTGAGALSLTTLTGLARDLLDDTTKSGMQSTLGLGTAAVANMTTSATDTTAGRVLKVGDFGLGAADVPALADLNTLVATGLWAFTASTLNIPPAPATGGTVMVLGRTAGGGSAGTQLAVTSNSNRTFTRSQAGGWNPWVEVWTSGGTNTITLDFGSFGYGTGSGGTVTQATSKSTAVTLNKPSGRIITTADSLVPGAFATFALNNNKFAITDCLIVNTVGNLNYRTEVAYITTGQAGIRVTNVSGTTLAEALLINFTIIKGAIA